VRSGFSGFQCPLCRDRHRFQREMLTMGIHIPVRLLSSHPASQGRRVQGLCRARECPAVLPPLCPQSREPLCFPRPQQLLFCCSCAAEGTHQHCSHLKNFIACWECHSCAGPSSRKRQSIWMPWGGGLAVG
ncbi:PHF7 protein, partial [Bucorvus abyssinicus]|nr:PHF7 protein [Bucorvus abyssinicus]